MRFFCITLGTKGSCNYFYVEADRIEFATNLLCRSKLGDIRFYVGSKNVCFVDHYKVYEVEEIIGEESKILYREGNVLC
ncbi:MAG: hypothetical protein J6S67_20035 [Methanobrevibacter sp.]|nr:hypothetical protein [Methanobrevibacter sp.]